MLPSKIVFPLPRPSMLGRCLINDLAKSWLLIVALVATCLAPSRAAAQVGQRVVTVNSGLQYEGILSSVPEIIEGAGGINPYETQNIVRIDDGMRQVFVSKSRIVRVGESTRNETSIPIFQRPYPGSEGGGSIVSVGPFDQYGHRELIIRAAGIADPIVYVQGITRISPRYSEVQTLVGADSKAKQWKMKIATGTIPTDVLRALMRTQIQNPDSPAEYLQIVDFFLQSQQFDNALDELRFMQSQFPDMKQRIDEERSIIRQAFAQQVLQEVRLRIESGQNGLAAAFAQSFTKEGIAGEILAEFRDVDRVISESQNRLDDTRKKFEELLVSFQNPDEKQSAAIKQLRSELETELNEINAPRLDAYLRLASDVTLPTEQKLALAISGWLLGSNNAIENFAIAQDMFAVRDLAAAYFSSNDVNGRLQILKKLAEFEAGTPKYLDPLIREMKPPAAPDLSEYSPAKPFEFLVEVPGPKAVPEPMQFRCLVELPPEYDPYRSYPLIVTLPGGRQTAEQNLEMWTGPFQEKLGVRVGHAGRNGYIVMAVDWRTEGQFAYTYTAREHATVMKALRGALRRFSIDSDRVFLSGHGIGGDAAYDIGLSHPEHWAGVISISGKMAKYLKIYAKNSHVDFPVYAVLGSKDFPNFAANKNQWNTWLPTKKYADCTVVVYDGRANELFVEEIPEIIKWMRAQRRRWPDKSGFSFKCLTLRPWDCYFWFLEFDGIPLENTIWPEVWRDTNVPRMVIEGETKQDNPNHFRVGPATTRIQNRLTLWLSPEFVDFDNQIHIKGRGKDFSGFVKPSTAILMEDIRRRADRKRPYWARIDCENFTWIVK